MSNSRSVFNQNASFVFSFSSKKLPEMQRFNVGIWKGYHFLWKVYQVKWVPFCQKWHIKEKGFVPQGWVSPYRNVLSIPPPGLLGLKNIVRYTGVFVAWGFFISTDRSFILVAFQYCKEVCLLCNICVRQSCALYRRSGVLRH